MKYKEILDNARTHIGQFCKACPECNGVACKNKMPGPGAKGIGMVAINNYNAWKDIYVVMDTIVENKKVDMSIDFFGQKIKYPFFAGPVGAVQVHYGKKYTDIEYNNILISSCSNLDLLSFTGDGVYEDIMIGATSAIKKTNGFGVPTIKPWNLETIKQKVKLVEDSGAIAIAMDIDAAGLPHLQNMNPPSGSKTTQELKEIISLTETPFIVKGIMSVKGALKAKEAGASAIVVSNHGGRVLDQCPPTAFVLEEIVDAVNGSMKVYVDGGIRSGLDVFKSLALGADGVLICRPFVCSLYGGEKEGIELYMNKLANELEDTMKMCGAATINEITRDMISRC